MAEIHVLRPLWLLGLLAAAALAWVVGRREDRGAQWRNIIAPHLLDHLLVGRRRGHRVRPAHLTVALIALGSVAAAGPAWEREQSPFLEDKAPLAIAIDLSRTMDATDVAPTRLERAKLKAKDLLALRPGARMAVFAYAGSAHMVLPLTDDANLIATYVDALATRIMPVAGKDTAAALRLVEGELARETVPGTILFLTDGVEPGAFAAFEHRAGPNEIMVLGIGTHLDVDGLRQLKRDAGIPLATVTADDADVQWIARRAETHLQQARAEASSRWRDAGWWLVIPVAALGALWFRRGWTICWTTLLLLTLVGPPGMAQAAESARSAPWLAPWLTPDQQGRLAFERGEYAEAAARFADPMWRGVAAYRAGRFADAADAFAGLDTPEADYNQADALARLGRLEPAIGSLDAALKQRPHWPAAEANLAILQAALIEKKKAEEEQPNQPNEKPDQVQFDDKGKQGKPGQVDVGQQTADMWMRTIQTTPADLLARRFAIEARRGAP